MSWLDYYVDWIQTQMFIEIRNVINDAKSSDRYWSKWVDKVWDEKCIHAMKLIFLLRSNRC